MQGSGGNVRDDRDDHVDPTANVVGRGASRSPTSAVTPLASRGGDGTWIDIGRQHPGLRAVHGQDRGDRATPGADVDRDPVLRQRGDRAAGQDLAVRSWHVTGVHSDALATERCRTGDPGQGFPGDAPGYQFADVGRPPRPPAQQFVGLTVRGDTTGSREASDDIRSNQCRAPTAVIRVERRWVEVGGVEPPSFELLVGLLRAQPLIDVGSLPGSGTL